MNRSKKKKESKDKILKIYCNKQKWRCNKPKCILKKKDLKQTPNFKPLKINKKKLSPKVAEGRR